MKFEVIGSYGKREENKPFKRVVSAESESLAREKALSLMGSEHKIKRRLVFIEKINELKE